MTDNSIDRAGFTALTCPACRIIDQADGAEDGRVFTPAHYPVRHENQLVGKLLRVQDHAADKVTTFAGSLRFVYIHTLWFGVWVALNVGVLGASLKFDSYPFGLLTMIVSLEAIFLSTFVMISQNRADARRQVFADHQYEMIQEESKQNELMIEQNKRIEELDKSILELTQEVRKALETA